MHILQKAACPASHACPTGYVLQVMHANTSRLTSSGSATSAAENLVGTMPGATQLTVMPSGPSSAARPLVRPRSAVLLTAYMAMGAGGLHASSNSGACTAGMAHSPICCTSMMVHEQCTKLRRTADRAPAASTPEESKHVRRLIGSPTPTCPQQSLPVSSRTPNATSTHHSPVLCNVKAAQPSPGQAHCPAYVGTKVAFSAHMKSSGKRLCQASTS
mgnify:CR=1 FL=1